MISGTLVLAVDTHCTGNTGTGLHRQEIAGSWHPRNLYMAASASAMHRFALSAHFAISLGFEQHCVELQSVFDLFLPPLIEAETICMAFGRHPSDCLTFDTKELLVSRFRGWRLLSLSQAIPKRGHRLSIVTYMYDTV